MSDNRRYITTPIYYVNDKPHIGHAYTTTVCDVYARFMRFAGREVFFLTGTDEHGMKVEKSAKERGVTPQQLADENAAEFRSVMEMFNLTFDHFIRTTDDEHERQVRKVIQKLLDTDAVYLGEFEGWYDEGQEEYYTETKAKELEYKSPVNKKPLVRAREENYYFRLSAYQEFLENYFAEHPEFVRPVARKNEVLSRIREGLQDVPMSRTNFTWGVQMPNAPEHVVYVWIDALMNYITALGLAEPEGETYAARGKFWPAEYHVIGKEILWFHAVIWPAMLKALEIPLPKCVYAHSFWIAEGQKMSKSLGNFIDLNAIKTFRDAYGGMDAFRYYVIVQGPLGSTDANFTAEHFHETYHTDLANTIGNCASRVTAMVSKYFDGEVPEDNGAAIGDVDWPRVSAETVKIVNEKMERMELAEAVEATLALVRRVDGFINATEPFKLAKDESKRDELAAILYRCAEAVRIASLLLWPVLPSKMEELWRAFGLEITPNDGKLAELAQWSGLQPGTKLQRLAMFPRVEQVVEIKQGAPVQSA
jgi:methionyl-tRNA synthetase